MIKRSDCSGIVAAVVIFLVFCIFTDGFLTQYNIFNVSRTASLYMFIAVGQALVLIVGGMNLSLGAIGSLSVVVFGYCCQNLGWGFIPALAASLAIGGVCGLANGLIISKLNLNPFIVTLATSFVFSGLYIGISQGYPYTELPAFVNTLGRGSFLKMPLFFWIMLVMAAGIWFVFKYTVFGRRLLATGGNATAARLSGINTARIYLIANVLSGVFAALAGFFFTARQGTASPTTGSEWMLASFAVAAMGGTALSGGSISGIGLVFSAYLYAFIKNGLVLLNVDMYYEQSYLGVIILAAICFETVRTKYVKLRHL
ncbi:MAG: ABC transporter permease [Clostridiales Family XIII bacterium]|nr:ABC transporter permease [Clostridiales Family XIII bacterium]